MNYIKIETDDDTTRWINLANVCRVTLSETVPQNEKVLIVIFADINPESRITIHGDSEMNLAAIDQIVHALDHQADLE